MFNAQCRDVVTAIALFSRGDREERSTRSHRNSEKSRILKHVRFIITLNSMSAQATLSATTIEEISERILSSRCITRQDQRLLMNLSFSCSFSDREQNVINRIYELLHKGFLKVVD